MVLHRLEMTSWSLDPRLASGPRAADATSGAARLPFSGVNTMKKNKNRERVIAQITLFHLIRLGNEHSCTVSREQAIAFLKEEERARDVESHDASWSGLHRVQLISAVRQPRMVRKDARIHAVFPLHLCPGVAIPCIRPHNRYPLTLAATCCPDSVSARVRSWGCPSSVRPLW